MIPVITIGGYLGAGKTTLINHLLRTAEGRRLAILVNEFGALAIDADLIEAESDRMISIAGGCVCCAFGDDLIGAVQDLQALSPLPDYILIETSGVAIPGAIAASLSLLPGVQPNGVVVLADAETIRRASEDPYIGDTIERQLHDADIVLLTKTDLVADSAAVLDWLSENAPSARALSVVQGNIALDLIAGPAREAQSSGNHSDAGYDSIVLTFSNVSEARALAETLATGPFGVIRAKGFVETLDGVKLLQIVGQRFEVTDAPEPRVPGVVCIGLVNQLDVEGLTSLAAPHHPPLRYG